MESRYSSEHRLNVEKTFQYYVLYIWYTLYHFGKKIKNIIILKSYIYLGKLLNQQTERERERERERKNFKYYELLFYQFYYLIFII